MPLQKYLDNTLHGECKIFVTQCTLAKITKEHEKATGGKGRRRPDCLPPPTELPLRYCKHKSDGGEDLGVVEEWRCLLDLLAGQPKGNEQAKNKQHYILATADAPEQEQEQKRRDHIEVRERARLIPGVPIVYVKRSVMILEELSAASERLRLGAEKEKFREGLISSDRKRKRGDEEEDEVLRELMEDEPDETSHRRVQHRAKGPNPMSVRKKKVKAPPEGRVQKTHTEATIQSSSAKRRKRGKKKSVADAANEVVGDETTPAKE